MVALEQRYHNMLKAFSFLRQDTLGVQEQYIDHQLAISKWLERVQYVIAGLLTHRGGNDCLLWPQAQQDGG